MGATDPPFSLTELGHAPAHPKRALLYLSFPIPMWAWGWAATALPSPGWAMLPPCSGLALSSPGPPTTAPIYLGMGPAGLGSCGCKLKNKTKQGWACPCLLGLHGWGQPFCPISNLGWQEKNKNLLFLQGAPLFPAFLQGFFFLRFLIFSKNAWFHFPQKLRNHKFSTSLHMMEMCPHFGCSCAHLVYRLLLTYSRLSSATMRLLCSIPLWSFLRPVHSTLQLLSNIL